MSGRVIYLYERTLTAQGADIEHIESQSLNSYGVVKIFFQKDVNIAAAVAQVAAASQTVLKFLPAGITPPAVLSYNASSVPILQLALSSTKLGETINIMTLGGLALAVGMLVDEGTVTLENIFYHLEQGKEIEPAILDGAQQIVVP